MLPLRRFLVLQLLMLWQGGFLFYAVFVVPVGGEVLGSAAEQGRITRVVTNSINRIGAVALLVLAWEMLSACRRRRVLVFIWLVMALSLLALAWTREEMLSITVDEQGRFYAYHRAYLCISALQWLAGLVFAFAMLESWRADDRASTRQGTP